MTRPYKLGGVKRLNLSATIAEQNVKWIKRHVRGSFRAGQVIDQAVEHAIATGFVPANGKAKKMEVVQ